MDFKIEPAIFEQHPDLILGVAVAHGVDNKGSSGEVITLLREAEKRVLESIGDQPISQLSHIAPWREAYRKFGSKPKEYHSSIENLVRRIAKGEEVRHINKLVDIYNFISLKYMVPVGGEDMVKIEGDVLLTVAAENEKPIVLLGEKEARPPHSGEVIYKDNNGAICRRWNWKEAERTKLTEETKDAFMVVEGLLPAGKEEIEKAIGELAGMVKKYCGGEVRAVILDKTKRQARLD